uniref:Uncharacterized protein n=1 Tax=Chelonoidis abingdonii TaxID=106734 RepID=A0A8C0IY83_CHEAB
MGGGVCGPCAELCGDRAALRGSSISHQRPLTGLLWGVWTVPDLPAQPSLCLSRGGRAPVPLVVQPLRAVLTDLGWGWAPGHHTQPLPSTPGPGPFRQPLTVPGQLRPLSWVSLLGSLPSRSSPAPDCSYLCFSELWQLFPNHHSTSSPGAWLGHRAAGPGLHPAGPPLACPDHLLVPQEEPWEAGSVQLTGLVPAHERVPHLPHPWALQRPWQEAESLQ